MFGPCPLRHPAFYLGEVINVLWMRSGGRDGGSLPPLLASNAKNIRLKLSFALVMTAEREREREGDVADDDATRYIDS